MDYSYMTDEEVIQGLEADLKQHWTKWGWKKTGGWNSYNFARMEDYRNRVNLAYHLYDRISFEHLKREIGGLPPEALILDAGGGTAGLSILLAMLGYRKITLLDISGEWLKWAKVKIDKAGFDKEIRLIHGDIRKMSDFADNSFDFSFALGGVVSYCRGAGEGLKELCRVTKPGGRILFNAHNKLYSEVLRMKSGNYSTSEEDSEEKVKEDDSEKNRQKPGIAIESFDPDKLKDMVTWAGFVNVRIMVEYFFVPDDSILRTEKTKEWEEAIVKGEMEHCNDSRFLSGGMILISGEKK